MKFVGRTNPIRLIVFAVVVVFAFLAFAFGEELKESVKSILDSRWSTGAMWIYIFSCALMQQMFIGSNERSSGLIYAQFGKYADFVFALVVYLPASAASMALLKGLYMQRFFDAKFFIGFDDIDLLSIFVVSTFLLYYALNRSTLLLMAALQNKEASPVTKA